MQTRSRSKAKPTGITKQAPKAAKATKTAKAPKTVKAPKAAKAPKAPPSKQKKNVSPPETDESAAMAANMSEVASKELFGDGSLLESLYFDNHFPFDELRSTVDEKAPLEEQIKFLKDRHARIVDYITHRLEEKFWLRNSSAWTDLTPWFWSKQISSIHRHVEGFAETWVYRDSSKRALTKKQKSKLVASLDGYCVQEDFDTIVSLMNNDHQQLILRMFAISFLMKTAVEKFFQHPFWYVEVIEKGAEGTGEEASWQGVSPEGAVLERFLARVEEAQPIYARIWRNITVRLCQKVPIGDAGDDTFSATLDARRRARCHSLAKEMLADETFQCLLKPTDEIDRRATHLGNCLSTISELVIPMLTQQQTLIIRTLHDLEPEYHHEHRGMEMDYHHATLASTLVYKEDPSRLDGHRVLMIRHPFFTRINTVIKGEPSEQIVLKAPVIMAEQEAEKKAAEKEALRKLPTAKEKSARDLVKSAEASGVYTEEKLKAAREKAEVIYKEEREKRENLAARLEAQEKEAAEKEKKKK